MVQLRPGIVLNDADLSAFVNRHGIVRLELFGSALRDDFRSDSDVDLLVTFAPGRTPGLIQLAAMELEIGSSIGREVELRTREDLSKYFRKTVSDQARGLYAA